MDKTSGGISEDFLLIFCYFILGVHPAGYCPSTHDASEGLSLRLNPRIQQRTGTSSSSSASSLMAK